MGLEDLDRGEKREIHVHLFEKELATLDGAARRYRCSRAQIIGALLDDFARTKKDLTAKVRIGEPGAPSRRS